MCPRPNRIHRSKLGKSPAMCPFVSTGSASPVLCPRVAWQPNLPLEPHGRVPASRCGRPRPPAPASVTWYPACPAGGVASPAGQRRPPPHQAHPHRREMPARLAGLNLVSGDFSRALGAERSAILQVRPAAPPPQPRREGGSAASAARKRRERRGSSAVGLRTICRPLPS